MIYFRANALHIRGQIFQYALVKCLLMICIDHFFVFRFLKNHVFFQIVPLHFSNISVFRLFYTQVPLCVQQVKFPYPSPADIH